MRRSRQPRLPSDRTPAPRPGGGRGQGAASRRDFAARLKRFPCPGPAALTFTLLAVVASNGYLLWQILHGELRVMGVVLLVVLEALLLTACAGLQLRRIPPAHRLATGEPGGPSTATPASLLLGLLPLLGAYAMWAWLLGEWTWLRDFFQSVQPWLSSGVLWALALSMGLAMASALADQRHYRRVGPPLVSSLALDAEARRVLLAYGAIVIAIPMIGALALAMWGVPTLLKGRKSTGWRVFGGLLMVGLVFGMFFLLATTIDSGPPGWASVYLLNKVMVEGAFVLLPLIQRRSAAVRT